LPKEVISDFIFESDNGAFVLLPWNISTLLRQS
jgi:hypothetical protein